MKKRLVAASGFGPEHMVGMKEHVEGTFHFDPGSEPLPDLSTSSDRVKPSSPSSPHSSSSILSILSSTPSIPALVSLYSPSLGSSASSSSLGSSSSPSSSPASSDGALERSHSSKTLRRSRHPLDLRYDKDMQVEYSHEVLSLLLLLPWRFVSLSLDLFMKR